jgi:putative transposase
MHQQSAEVRVSRLCRMLEVSRRGYKAWRARPSNTQAEAAQQVQEQVPPYFAQGRGPYGTRRITHLLAPEGLQVSRRRLGRLRTQAGLRGTTRRTCQVPTPAAQAQTGAPHQRNREFPVTAPDTLSVGDIPSLPTGAGWRYLAIVLELCSRAVVGWSMANHLRMALGNQVLSMALCQRQPAAGLIMPTDRGRQSGADQYRQLLARHGRQPRMSRKGNGWANVVAESFLHTVKTALMYLEDCDTHEQAQTAVCADIAVFSNRQRCQAANGYLAPLAYERTLQTRAIFCPEKC